jgi:hypothetical protein
MGLWLIHAEMCNTGWLYKQTSSYLTWCWRQTDCGISLGHMHLTAFTTFSGEINLTSPISSLATTGHTQLHDRQIKHWDPSAHSVWTGHAAQEPYPRWPPIWDHTTHTRSPYHQEGLCHFVCPIQPMHSLLPQINRVPIMCLLWGRSVTTADKLWP